jgi:hypothetical protein
MMMEADALGVTKQGDLSPNTLRRSLETENDDELNLNENQMVSP